MESTLVDDVTKILVESLCAEINLRVQNVCNYVNVVKRKSKSININIECVYAFIFYPGPDYKLLQTNLSIVTQGIQYKWLR